MLTIILLKLVSIICFDLFLHRVECFHKSWKFINDDDNDFELMQDKSSKGLALDGRIASVIDHSFIVSYHYKKSGRLFCSGFAITPYWTLSVPNCFNIPVYYYRNKEENIRRKRDNGKYLNKNKPLELSNFTKSNKYTTNELRDLRTSLSLKPNLVVILTAFDENYIPCKFHGPLRISKEIIVHENYEIPSHNAEIALVKVSSPLTEFYQIKMVNKSPINIKNDIKCKVVGYGLLKLNRSVHFQVMLSTIDVQVYSPETCEEISRNYNVTIDAEPSNYICSYNKKYSFGSPLSQGDSGAPLICNNSVVGVAQWVFSDVPGYFSYGPSQHTPHLYTKLDRYKEWIFEHINE